MDNPFSKRLPRHNAYVGALHHGRGKVVVPCRFTFLIGEPRNPYVNTMRHAPKTEARELSSPLPQTPSPPKKDADADWADGWVHVDLQTFTLE